MDRRDFIKKTAMAAVATGITAPVAAMLNKGGSSLEPTEEADLSASNLVSEKKKVLLVNGSPRSDGNTFCALTEVATQLEKHGLATEIVQIGRGAIRSCINCGGCRQAGECVFDDDICNSVAQKMSKSDALIVGSPVYYGQPNGGVLSLMQRLFYSAGHTVQNKPAAAVAVCRRGGATAAFQTMNMMFEMMNIPIVTSQYWNIVYGMSKGQARLDTEGMQTMRTLAHNMAWLLEKIHAGGTSSPERESGKEFMNFIR